MQRKNEIYQVVQFELIENVQNIGKKYSLFFDDSCEKISNSKQFAKIFTAGRHGDRIQYILSMTFSSKKIGREVELQNTDIVLFKSREMFYKPKQLAIN